MADSAREAALRVRNLRKTYKDVVAVDGLDLEVSRGECFGLLGPNGAGKTTTVEICEGLTVPDSGDVEVLGMRWAADAAKLRQRLGIQLQDTQLSDKLTVFETIRLFRSFFDAGPAPAEIISLMQLDEKRGARVGSLSGGQKQRLALACALVGDPAFLFLDEPTTGLDPQARRQLWELIDRFKLEGRTILLTTHYMDEAERCSHVAYLYFGKLIADGTPDSLRELPDVQLPGTLRIEITTPQVTRALRFAREIPGVRSATIFGQSIHALVDENCDMEGLRKELLKKNIIVAEIRPLAPSLEDVFVELTSKHQAEQEATCE